MGAQCFVVHWSRRAVRPCASEGLHRFRPALTSTHSSGMDAPHTFARIGMQSYNLGKFIIEKEIYLSVKKRNETFKKRF